MKVFILISIRCLCTLAFCGFRSSTLSMSHLRTSRALLPKFYTFNRFNTRMGKESFMIRDIYSLGLKDLQLLCQDLLNENESLKAAIEEAVSTAAESRRTRAGRADFLHQLKISGHLSVSHFTGFMKLMHEVETESAQLMTDTSALSVSLTAIEKSTQNLKNSIQALKVADTPITIRKAMLILERTICRDVAGSKSKFARFSYFEKIYQSEDELLKASLKLKLESLSLTDAHIEVLTYIKDLGDQQATHHNNIPLLKKDEWTTAITKMVTDLSSSDDIGMALDLLKALEHYFPLASPAESWDLKKDPFKREEEEHEAVLPQPQYGV